MPVVAVSPPLIFGGTPTPTPTLAPAPTPVRTPVPPRATPTPRPVGTPTPAPAPLEDASSFVARHEQFIDRIDGLNACFKRAELSDFTDQEFSDHTQVAMKDRYIAQEKDMYCSMQGVSTLTKTLRRMGED